MADVLVIGSLNADLVVRAPRFPSPGETIRGGNLYTYPGGKGANQAVAASRQGANVVMVGRVGRDTFSPYLIENLESNNVDVTHIRQDNFASGTAIVIVDKDGQNSIVTSPGANDLVSAEDVDSAPDAKILLLQFEIPLDTVVYAAKKYKSKDTIVILNPAPATTIPDELLANVDLLIPNERELATLTEMEVTDVKSAEAAAKQLVKRGSKTVIVTRGNQGALIVTDKEVIPVDTYKVKVEDSTAAGDAFTAGLAIKLLESERLISAVRYGCACGALAATKLGAQPSLPIREDVENFLAKLNQ